MHSFHHGRVKHVISYGMVSVHLCKVLVSFILISSIVIQVFPPLKPPGLLSVINSKKKGCIHSANADRILSSMASTENFQHIWIWHFLTVSWTQYWLCLRQQPRLSSAANFGWNKHEMAAALNIPSLSYTRNNNKLSYNSGMWISWSSSTSFICIESGREY